MRANFVSRGLILAVVLLCALVSSSCQSDTGIGTGMDYPARWGGGTSGPTIFVGGPAF
jgi:predicted small secreted protein